MDIKKKGRNHQKASTPERIFLSTCAHIYINNNNINKQNRYNFYLLNSELCLLHRFSDILTFCMVQKTSDK